MLPDICVLSEVQAAFHQRILLNISVACHSCCVTKMWQVRFSSRNSEQYSSFILFSVFVSVSSSACPLCGVAANSLCYHLTLSFCRLPGPHIFSLRPVAHTDADVGAIQRAGVT